VNRKIYGFALLAVAAAMMLAACGSSSSGGAYGGSESSGTSEEASAGEKSNASESSSGGGYSGKGGAYAPPSEETSASGGGEAAPVSTGNAKEVGEVLVDSEGMTLYYFEKDQKGSGKSKCAGPCAEAWPPLLTEGEPKAMSGANASMLGTIERSDGTTQVTYAGWPLYTFVEDKKPGEDNGTDSKAFGASWYPLHPNGEKAGH
jgi:predicted lipoprotein with Yx(FWY)xxD motif